MRNLWLPTFIILAITAVVFTLVVHPNPARSNTDPAILHIPASHSKAHLVLNNGTSYDLACEQPVTWKVFRELNATTLWDVAC